MDVGTVGIVDGGRARRGAFLRGIEGRGHACGEL